MGYGCGISLDKTGYYIKYYQRNKIRIKMYYLEKKEKKLANERLYKDYSSEEEYYKHALIKMGFLKLN